MLYVQSDRYGGGMFVLLARTRGVPTSPHPHPHFPPASYVSRLLRYPSFWETSGKWPHDVRLFSL
jgi:hypothetical protein